MIDIEEAESVSLSAEQNDRIDKLEERVEKLVAQKENEVKSELAQIGEVIGYFFMVWLAIIIGAFLLAVFFGHPFLHLHDGDTIWVWPLSTG